MKKALEQAEKDTKMTLSLGEALRLETGDYQTLANKFYKLKHNNLMLSSLLVMVY
jgi:hypothetical protein